MLPARASRGVRDGCHGATLRDPEVHSAGLDIGWIAAGRQLAGVSAGLGDMAQSHLLRGDPAGAYGGGALVPCHQEDLCGQLLVAFACD